MLPLTIVASYQGIQWFGLPGGAIGSVICSALTQMLAVKKVCSGQRVLFNSLYDIRTLILYLALAIGSAASSFFIIAPLCDSGFTRLLFGGIAAACAFTLLTYTMNIMPALISKKIASLFQGRSHAD